MLFTDPIFLFYFLPIALIGHRLLLGNQEPATRYPTHLRLLLFIATCVFYGFQEPWYLAPYFLCVASDLFWAKRISSTDAPRARLWFLRVAITQSLLMFFLLKYFPWVCSVIGRLEPSLSSQMPTLAQDSITLGLPPGISFYTFESMSFVIDVYRRLVVLPKSRVTFLGFIGMFPRFVAGPIVRFRDVAHQFERYQGMKVEEGLVLFASGLLRKVLLADSFAVFVAYGFHRQQAVDPVSAWIGGLAYTFQLYLDFSGYSLMAIGLGKVLGFDFAPNFDRPLQADSLQEFWRRWHMSLSSWFRDYVYEPLGGSRRGTSVRYRNLMIVMLLSGIWHGAGPNFVFWGLWHGCLLCMEHALNLQKRLPRWIHRILTFFVVMFGFVIFRAETRSIAVTMLKSMLGLGERGLAFNPEGLERHGIELALCAIGVPFVLWFEGRYKVPNPSFSFRWQRSAAMFAILLLAIIVTLSSKKIPFLYFQF